jgi:hypothetical protein
MPVKLTAFFLMPFQTIAFAGILIFHLTAAFSSTTPAVALQPLPFPKHFLLILQPLNKEGIATE